MSCFHTVFLLAQFLLESGANVESTDLEGRTALHVTAWQGHVHMVALLLAHGARVDAEDLEQRTPLQSAAWQGKTTPRGCAGKTLAASGCGLGLLGCQTWW